MGKAIVTTSIFFDDNLNEGKQSGYLIVKSTETIFLDNIKGFIFFEARGRMSSQKDEILSFFMDNPPKLNKNESHKIPFSFDLPTNLIATYNGKNVSFSYNFEARIFVNDNDLDKLEKSVFSKIKSFITADDSLKFSEHFIVDNFNGEYSIKEAKSYFKIQPNLLISILCFLVFGGIYAFVIPKFNAGYIFLGIVLSILLIYLTIKYIGNSLGVVSMETLREEHAFLCKIKKTRKFNLTNQTVFYEVLEKVEDNRGTSSSTYTEVIHTSTLKRLKKFSGTADLVFDYPSILGLYSFDYKDVSIVWRMNLKGVYLGFNLKYTCEFHVERNENYISK